VTASRTCWLWLVLGWCLLAGGARAADVPSLTGRVVDNAEILKPETRRVLAAQLEAHERETTDQVAVLTVATLDGENIEDYANRVFRAWGLGRRDRNNGVLVVIVPSERAMRIEVGYGLEGRLTDLAAGRIIRNVMTPHFRSGDFDRGVSAGVAAVLGQLRGEAAADAAPPARDRFFDGPDLSIPERILIGAFVFGIIGLFTVIGVLTPGVGWFLYVFLIPFWAAFPIVVLGVNGALTLLGIYLVGFPLAKLLIGRSDWYKKAGQDLRSKGRASIGGFTITSGSGGSGGSSWSSGSSGGGFSGGGSSGGGGASGRW